MIAYSIMFNSYGGEPSLWQQTNPETAGLQGIVIPFIHYYEDMYLRIMSLPLNILSYVTLNVQAVKQALW